MTAPQVPYRPPPQVAQQAYANGQAQQLMLQGPAILLHGFQKVGKSSEADTGPEPRLTLDIENSAIFTPSRKIVWDPMHQPMPPMPDGRWQTCVVLVRDFAVLDRTVKILNTGQHPFNSIAVDSVPAIQHRVMKAEAGYRKMEYDNWGVLLRQTTQIIWDLKDLLTHPTKRVWAVTFVCSTHWDKKQRKYRPYLMGQSADQVPYVPDAEGWVYIAPDGSRRVWFGPSKDYETGNRLWGRLPDEMVLGYPGMVEGWTIEAMARQVIETQRR